MTAGSPAGLFEEGRVRRQGSPQLVPSGEPDQHFDCDD